MQKMRKGQSATKRGNERHIQSIETHHYEGAIPHPIILREFNEIVAGSAELLFKSAGKQAQYRRDVQLKALEANIYAQQQDLEIRKAQSKSVFQSDMLGQIFGFVICIACIFGAIYAGKNGQLELSLALTAMPTAALIKEFFVKKN